MLKKPIYLFIQNKIYLTHEEVVSSKQHVGIPWDVGKCKFHGPRTLK
jgi:hypothetical protein